MTIYREKKISLQREKAIVLQHIRKILEVSPTYYGTIEGVDDTFVTNIQPHMFFLNTPMTIDVEEQASTTIVKVSIKSQPFIRGDIFNYYNKYIDEFFLLLRREMDKV